MTLIPTLIAAVLLFAGVAPESATGWMEPQHLDLTIGMSRSEAEKCVARSGVTMLPGKQPDHLIVSLSDRRTITLAFENGSLQSMRFELVDFIPQIRKAFDEVSFRLVQRHGLPTRKTANPAVILYEAPDPRIYVVASMDKTTDFGRQGLGFLVVRYFAPPVAP